MIEERGGWFVVNVKDANWQASDAFGSGCNFGHRRGEAHRYFYPESEQARKYGAEAPEPTDRVPVAYSDVAPRRKIDPPAWPLD